MLAGVPLTCGKSRRIVWCGEVGNKGKICAIPGHAPRVLVIDPTGESPTIILPIDPSLMASTCGCEESVAALASFAAPCHADSMLRIDPEKGEASTINCARCRANHVDYQCQLRTGQHRRDGKHQVVGGPVLVGHDGKVFFFPSEIQILALSQS